MARQIGIIPIKGTIDGLTFYEHPDDGHLVKKKTRVTGERVKTHPNFMRTMLNAGEFKTSVLSATLLRCALSKLLFPAADGKLSSRMNRALVRVVQMDEENGLGERIPRSSNLVALEGFDLNRSLHLLDAFTPKFEVNHDVESREIQVDVPRFTPSKAIHAPDYVEYFQLISGAAAVNFGTKHYTQGFWETERVPLNEEPIDALRFPYPMKLSPGYTLFIALGVLFYAQLDKIPKNATSQRKRRKLSNGVKEGEFVRFMGAVAVIKVIAGKEENPENKERNDEWEMDGMGIA
jgi:hypothetical protein